MPRPASSPRSPDGSRRVASSLSSRPTPPRSWACRPGRPTRTREESAECLRPGRRPRRRRHAHRHGRTHRPGRHDRADPRGELRQPRVPDRDSAERALRFARVGARRRGGHRRTDDAPRTYAARGRGLRESPGRQRRRDHEGGSVAHHRPVGHRRGSARDAGARRRPHRGHTDGLHRLQPCSRRTHRAPGSRRAAAHANRAAHADEPARRPDGLIRGARGADDERRRRGVRHIRRPVRPSASGRRCHRDHRGPSARCGWCALRSAPTSTCCDRS